MFYCEKCNKLQPPKKKPLRLVTQTRAKTYVNFARISTGHEIVSELRVCEKCISGNA